jgi:predicted AAA+ superfamily ATPase
LWEQIVLANIKGHLPQAEVCYYRTAGGAEMDFVVKNGSTLFAVECKASYSPALTKGSFAALEDIKPAHTFVAAPVPNGWPIKPGIDVVSLEELRAGLAKVI